MKSLSQLAVVTLAAAALPLLAATPSHAGESVAVVVLKEHGVGSAAQAQPYVDKLVGAMAKSAGWGGATGSYQTTRAGAEKWATDNKAKFGIFSLAGFLGLRTKHKLTVLGQVTSSRAGGQEYHLISKTASDLAGCKGKTLATDHNDDTKFIDGVVFAGKVKLSDFTVVATTRPLQTVKKVTAGEAVCALIDDAQFAELKNVEGGSSLKSVWKSAKLPGMVVAAFPAASAAEQKTLQGTFAKLCEGDNKTACGEVGLSSVKAASDADYKSAIDAYK